MYACLVCNKKFEDKKNNSANLYCGRDCWNKRGFTQPKIGTKHNRWLVVGIAYRKKRRTYVPCECECGTTRDVEKTVLLNGRSKSCGCWKKEVDTKRHYVHGQSYSRIYNIWKNMRRRCQNPRNTAYKYYGGRGIGVCKEWEDPSTFFAWAKANGYKKNLSLDRINPDGNYEPSNCRFVTWDIQLKNRRPYQRSSAS